MLAVLRGKSSERKLRLFGCGCCRQIWSLFTDERNRVAVEVTERYADRLATLAELMEAWGGANVARDLAFGPASTAPRRHRSRLGRVTSWAAYALTSGFSLEEGFPLEESDGCELVWANMKDVAECTRQVPGKVRRLQAMQAHLLRDIIGNLFRPLPPVPAFLLEWNDGLLIKLAQTAYEDRRLPAGELDHARLAVLTDALLDAGCPPDHELLLHLREVKQPHVRGCFAVDLILRRA